jgi:DNA-binding HxlR family transcriptional regulator
MASPLGYQRFCPIGAALNAIGDRWALLIVRDLMLGPRRYSDLLRGLGGVGTDILATRLRDLEDAGVVRRVGAARGSRYELTDSGKELRPVLVELARWGAGRLELPEDPLQVPPRVPLTALLVSAQGLPPAANGIYTFKVADEIVYVEVTAGQIVSTQNSDGRTTISLTNSGLRALILGTPLANIQDAGDVSIDGDRRSAVALLNSLSGPPLLGGFRRQLATRGPRGSAPTGTPRR